MAFREIVSNLGLALTLGPATLAADTNGAAVDTLGFDSALIELAIGVGGITFDGTNKIEFKLESSEDNSTWTGVSQADVQAAPGQTVTVGAGGIIKSLTAAKAAVSVDKFAYVGLGRYLRVVADFSGTHGTGTPICAIIALGHAHQKPVA